MSRTIIMAAIITVLGLWGTALTFAETPPEQLTPAEAAQSIAQADPNAVASSKPATVSGEKVDPELGLEGQSFESSGTLVATSVAKEADGGVELESKAGKLTVTPLDVATTATEGALVGDSAVVYANTADESDTVIKALPKGVETFTNIRGDDAPEEFGFKIDLPGDETLVKQPDGGVVVIDPTPASADKADEASASKPGTQGDVDALKAEGKAPAELELPDTGAAAEVSTAVSQAGAVAAGDDPAPAAAPEADPAEAADPPADVGANPSAEPSAARVGEVAEALKEEAQDKASTQTKDLYADAQQTAAQAEEQVQDVVKGARAVAEIKPPVSVDANGDSVPTTLEVSGDTVTMVVKHDEDSAYPIAADPVILVGLHWVNRPIAVFRPQVVFDRWDWGWQHGGTWLSQWMWNSPIKWHIGGGWWQFWDARLGWVTLQPTSTWVSFYVWSAKPVFKTVPVFSHWQNNYVLEAYLYVAHETRGPMVSWDHNFQDVDALEDEPSSGIRLVASRRRAVCKNSSATQPAYILGLYAYTNYLEARWCYNRSTHKAAYAKDDHHDQYTHISPGERALGVTAQAHWRAPYTSAFGGYRYGQSVMSARYNFCQGIRWVACGQDWNDKIVIRGIWNGTTRVSTDEAGP